MQKENREHIKRKTDLMSSIMKNPKLSKTLKEAMSAPIGSTKRAQAKSILSVMRKMNGMKNDGIGGPNMFPVQQVPQQPVETPINYGNMMIFPAAPKFKTKIVAVKPDELKINGNTEQVNTQDGQGGIWSNIVNFFNTNSGKTTDSNTLDTSASLLNKTPTKDFSGLGLTVAPYGTTSNTKNGLTSSSDLTKTPALNIKNTSVNGVVTPEKIETLNTDPNQSISSYVKNNNVSDSIKNLGLKVNPIQPEQKASGLTGGITVDDNTIKNSTPPTIPQTKSGFAKDTNGNILWEYDLNGRPIRFLTVEKQQQLEEEANKKKTDTSSLIPQKDVKEDINNISNIDTTKKENTNKNGYFNDITSAVKNIASGMGVDPIILTQVGIKDAANEYGEDTIISALIPLIKKNEGSSLNGVTNNPGNIKYTGLTGQIDSGIKAQDGGTFASYTTEEAGDSAMASLLKNIISGGTSYGENPTMAQVVNGWTNSTGEASMGSNFTGTNNTGTNYSADISGAANALKSGIGSVAYAMDVANKQFGGSLSSYVEDLDQKLRKEFKLEDAELELSELKSKKENLIPSLTSYIKGKDKYLKVIDQMIEDTEETLLHRDMGNPAVATSYNNYLNYLYKLKGRQEERYGNYLTSTVDDYNADLTKAEENYTNVYNDYKDALTSKSTIAQEEYNSLYTRMASLYTELENAPLKRANLEAVQLQNLQNQLTMSETLLGQNNKTNIKYWDDVSDYTDQITDKDGNLDLTKVTSAGLISLYQQNTIQGGDQVAMTEAIRRAIAKNLETNSSPENVAKVTSLINELSQVDDPYAKVYAESLSSSISGKVKDTTSAYIEKNIDKVKIAAKELVKGNMWGRKPGLEDMESWISSNSSLDRNFLISMYTAFKNNIQPGTSYAEDPMSYVKNIFSGLTDKENAENLAERIAASS